MTGTPALLIETPQDGGLTPASDLLSDLLRVVRLAGSVFFKADYGAPFTISSEGCAMVEGLLGGVRPRHITVFHLVSEGQCWLDRPGYERVLLSKGDVMMLPFGDYHLLGNGEAPVVAASSLAVRTREGVMTPLRHGGDGDVTTVVCGFVESGDLFFNPVFRDLPSLLIERTAQEPVTSLLATTVRQLLTEVDALRPGSREMLGRMMEMLFFEMVRRYVAGLPPGAQGWLGALTDPLVSRSLQVIHADPMRGWTVEQIAAAAGTSRSVLAERFKAVLGQPPMQYLAGWRLQLATNLLRDATRSIAEVAGEVGYESEAAFNRAFKRHLGVPPGAWRQNHVAA
jgi:AraC family transcriptional regulator, alkane utilization regulator